MLELDIEISLKPKKEYGSVSIADTKKRLLLRVDSDAPKRKIITRE